METKGKRETSWREVKEEINLHFLLAIIGHSALKIERERGVKNNHKKVNKITFIELNSSSNFFATSLYEIFSIFSLVFSSSS